jgi:hypothetical protein
MLPGVFPSDIQNEGPRSCPPTTPESTSSSGGPSPATATKATPSTSASPSSSPAQPVSTPTSPSPAAEKPTIVPDQTDTLDPAEHLAGILIQNLDLDSALATRDRLHEAAGIPAPEYYLELSAPELDLG